MTSYYPARCGGYRHCKSADIVPLICHVISQKRVTQDPSDILGWEPLKISQHHSLWQCRYNCLSLSRDFVRPLDQRFMSFYSNEPSREVKILPILVTIDTVAEWYFIYSAYLQYRDMMGLVFHVILEDHMIKVTLAFIVPHVKSPSSHVLWL